MYYKIKYYEIGYDAGLFSLPEFSHEEIVEAYNLKNVGEYILSKKDNLDNKYEKDKSFGFDYISKRGGVKIKKYKPPKIKKV